MSFKNFVCNWFNCNEECIKEKNNLSISLDKSIADFETKKSDLMECRGYKISLEHQVANLEETVKTMQGLIKPLTLPEAYITYSRPVLVSKNNFIQTEIDVRNFIMPDYLMKKEIIEKDLFYNETQDLDHLIPEVYKLSKKKYSYGSDSNYGFSEYWMFSFELRTVLKNNKRADCDDYAINTGSYFAAANIPRNKWWVSAGLTRDNFGHATVYAKDSEATWRHLNSTTPMFKFNDLKKYPSKDNENDFIGIKEDGWWFSFNDYYAVHKFENSEAKTSFARETKLSSKVKIRRTKK